MTIKAELDPSDILCAILVLSKRQSGKNQFNFRAHNFNLQRIFYNLRQSNESLRNFIYSDSGPEPYSPILDDSFTNLGFSGLISRRDPQNPEVVYLNQSGENYYEQILLPILEEQQIKGLEKIASQFLDSLKTENRL